MHANAEVDRLLVDARESFADACVRADYRPSPGARMGRCPWIWLYEQPDMLAISKKLKGVHRLPRRVHAVLERVARGVGWPREPG